MWRRRLRLSDAATLQGMPRIATTTWSWKKGMKDFFLRASRRNQTCWHADFRLLAFWTVWGKTFYCVKPQSLCLLWVTSYGSPRQWIPQIPRTKLQQYVNRELPDVQAGFRKGKGTRDQIANICWIMEKARGFQKNIYFCFIDYTKAFDCVDHNKLWKFLKEMGIPDHLTCLLRTYMQVRKQQLELDMEQQTGSK